MASKRFLRIKKFLESSPERIYLCNWYVYLVKPGKELPDNQVQCHVPIRMTKFDIKNYFERIYNVKIDKVNTRIQHGKEKRRLPWNIIIKKKTDYKVAYLTLGNNQIFHFPNLFSKYENRR